MGGGGRFGGCCGEVLASGGTKVGGVRGIIGIVPRAEGVRQLRDDDCEIAEDGESGTIAAEFFGANVDLDELRVGVPFGGVSEMEDPI